MSKEAVVRVGLIGCGNISGIYLQNSKRFTGVEIVACADLDIVRARLKATEHGIPRVLSADELLADSAIDIVLNLTIPNAHAGVSLRAIEAGKHVYSEKPLATVADDGRRILEAAQARNLRVGCAPDTIMGSALQTCRKVIDAGEIGTPVGASAFMTCRGHERWHPDPAFYYQTGGGPMLDMGPYYLAALVHLLGPINRVTGSSRITFPERTITSQPRYGERIRVEVPTHVTGILEFESGVVGNIMMTFDVWHSILPRIELYGSEGSMIVPDPNNFGGQVMLRKAADTEWTEIPLIPGITDNGRGIGLADMAAALDSGGKHRASGEMGLHVLEAMEGFQTASESGKHYELKSTAQRPQPFFGEEGVFVS